MKNEANQIREIAHSQDARNRQVALELSKAVELNDKELQHSCGNILDKVPMLGSPIEVREQLSALQEKYPKMYNRYIQNL